MNHTATTQPIKMEENIRIAIDVDGTLADVHRLFLQRYNEDNDTDISFEDFTDWGFGDTEVTTQCYLDYTHEIWKGEGEQIPLSDTSAPEKIAELYNHSGTHRVDLVTARQGREEEMEQWLTDMGIVEYDEFYSSDDKAQNGYDAYIDDNPNLYTQLMFFQFQFIVDKPWNRMVENGQCRGRIDSVSDAVDDLLLYFSREGL